MNLRSIDLLTSKEIEEFILQHPIKTGGSLNEYRLSCEEFDDGDTGVVVTLPFWFQNRYVVRDVLQFAQDAFVKGAEVHVLQSEIKAYFYTSICDPG